MVPTADSIGRAAIGKVTPGAVLLVTGDHGMVDVLPEDRIDVVTPQGEHVARHHARAGKRHVLPGPGFVELVVLEGFDVRGERL